MHEMLTIGGRMGLAVALFSTCVCVPAQPQFQKRMGALYLDRAHRVIQTQDGHFMVIGVTNSFGSLGNALLMKVDPQGTLLWVKDYAGINSDHIYDILELNDGSLVTCGSTGSYGAGSSDAFVMKTDSAGALIWTRVYGDIDSDAFHMIDSDGGTGFYVCGRSRLWPLLHEKATISRLDDQGSLIWSRCVDHPNSSVPPRMVVCASGGTVVCNSASGDLHLWRFSTSGALLWSNIYTPTPTGSGLGGLDIQESTNGDITVTTSHFSQGTVAESLDILAITLDSNGTFISNTSYGGTYSDEARNILITSDGGLLLGGRTTSAGNGGWDVGFIKLHSGAVQWAKAYGTVWTEEPYSVQETSDGGFIMAGLTYSTGADPDSAKIYLLKTDSLGNAGCNDVPWTPVTAIGSMIVAPGDPSDIMLYPFTSTVSWSANDRSFYSAEICAQVSIRSTPDPALGCSCVPNPFSARATLHSTSWLSDVTILIEDRLGRVVKQAMWVDGTACEIDRSGLPNGLFFARLVRKGRVLATVKLLVADD